MALRALKSRRVVQPHRVGPGVILVRDGIIDDVVAEAPPGVEVTDVGALAVSPGTVDCHVHMNEPGRTEWEGFETATRAAAAGGVTTVVDMPLNSVPVTTTRAALDAKLAASEGRCFVDVGFWGGVVPDNTSRSGRAGGGRRPRVQGVPGALRDRRLSQRDGERPRRGDARAARPWPAAPRACRARSRRPRERAEPEVLPRVPAVAAARMGGRSHPPARRPVPAHAVRRAHRAPVVGVVDPDASCRAGRGPARHRRDVSPLPVPRSRVDPRRRDSLQVRAAHPRPREPRGAVGRALRGRHRLRRSPTTARAPRPSSCPRRETSTMPGAASRRCSSACRRCGPRRGGAARISCSSRAG